MAKGYFFIKTPTQYLQACEAYEHFKGFLESVELIVMNTDMPLYSQFAKMIDLRYWEYVVYGRKIDARFNNKIINIFPGFLQIIFTKKMIDTYLIKIKKDDYVFIGNLGERELQWLLENVKSKNKILIDDGLATLNIVNSLKENKRLISKSSALKSILYNVLFYCKGIDIKECVFFSYLSKIRFEPGRYVCNDLAVLRRKFWRDDYNKGNSVIFVGQPIAEVGLIEREKYNEIVAKVRTYYQTRGYDFQYCAHKGERGDCFSDDWDVVSYDYPIEVEILNSSILPAFIVSFYSSALITLKVLFGDLIDIVYVPIPVVSVGGRRILSYDYFEAELSDSFMCKEICEFDDN